MNNGLARQASGDCDRISVQSMADEETDRFANFDKSSPSPATMKSDPWAPQSPNTESIPKLSPAPMDPLRVLISSESYIESLEKKLHRMKAPSSRNLKAGEMIQTLQASKDSHLAQMTAADQRDIFGESGDDSDSSVMHSIQRRLNPDKQAVNPLELVPLVNADVLAKVTEETEKDSCDSGTT